MQRQASNPRGKSGSRMHQNMAMGGTGPAGSQPNAGGAPGGLNDQKSQLKKLSQNLYKNTEQWLNQQMVDSQREITTNAAGAD